ncbi:16044_t:CDS:2 [Cetraspora pellucida]|uniref:16044_t:CDS:1 n=1 Tax=Cetraspora pellucida TaxID=1433469 RepID=A0ACA9PBK5_9GLOM|nr:16044_t:CDS:2 [Cetraspora pellucida]
MDNDHIISARTFLMTNSVGCKLCFELTTDKRQTDYPFLIWDSSEPNDILLTPNFDLKMQSKTVFIADGDNEAVDPELHQQCKAKVDELEYLVNHLKEELFINNIQHVNNVVNNMNRAFTIIKRDKTWNAKSWTMFL